MTVRPFHFKLASVSRRDCLITDALFTFLPRAGIRHAFQRATTDALTRHIGCPVTYRLEGVAENTAGSFLAALPDPLALIVVGMPPLEAKLFVDCEIRLARLIVEKMLGGERESPTEVAALSDIEQGVLEYLLLQLLAHIHRQCGEHPRVHFRFERFVATAEALRPLAASDVRIVVLTLRVTVGDSEGFVRLGLPHPLIAGAFVDVEGIGEERVAERVALRQRLRRYEYLRLPLWAEAGRATLKPADLGALEVGDVVILDASQVNVEAGKPVGRVILRAGAGHEGGFIADLTLHDQQARCHLVEEYRGE